MIATEPKTKKNQRLVEVIADLTQSLNEKEKRSITGRFGFTGKKETLSAIGRELKLSRERIRQIEKNSLRKMSEVFGKDNKNIIEEVKEAIKKNGGLVTDESMSEELLVLADNHKFAKNYIRLVCTIAKEIDKIDENNDLKNGWRLSSLSAANIISICNKIIAYLKETDIPADLNTLRENVAGISKQDENFIAACIDISAKLVMAKNGMVGLKSWPSVNPRNVRDKIYFVLKTAGNPLHFTEITSTIESLKFDNKKVVRATVHNELIADNRFVLIGRGIYALREWGYSDGTVYEVVKNILSNSKSPMSVSDIIELVNKSRKVKRNTIVINLQTKKEFKKVTGGYIYEKL